MTSLEHSCKPERISPEVDEVKYHELGALQEPAPTTWAQSTDGPNKKAPKGPKA